MTTTTTRLCVYAYIRTSMSIAGKCNGMYQYSKKCVAFSLFDPGDK